MPEFTSRAYGSGDRSACLSVFDSNVPRFFTEGERAEYTAFLDALPGPYLVIEGVDGTVVACGGYAQADVEGRADLCWGMVRQDLHGRGIGTLLTRARIEEALDDPRVRVVAMNTSQHTVDFYLRMGFHLESIERDGYGPGLDRCEMRLLRDEGRA